MRTILFGSLILWRLCESIQFAANYCPPDGSYLPAVLCGEPTCAMVFTDEICENDYQLMIPINTDISDFRQNASYMPPGNVFGSWDRGRNKNRSVSFTCGEKKQFLHDQNWGKIMKGAVVREGCTLGLFENLNFQGRSLTFNYQSDASLTEFRTLIGYKTIKSLRCHCKDEVIKCKAIDKGLNKVLSCEGNTETTCSYVFNTGIFKGDQFTNNKEERFRIGESIKTAKTFSYVEAALKIMAEYENKNSSTTYLRDMEVEGTITVSAVKKESQERIDFYQYTATCGDITWKFPIIKTFATNSMQNT